MLAKGHAVKPMPSHTASVSHAHTHARSCSSDGPLSTHVETRRDNTSRQMTNNTFHLEILRQVSRSWQRVPLPCCTCACMCVCVCVPSASSCPATVSPWTVYVWEWWDPAPHLRIQTTPPPPAPCPSSTAPLPLPPPWLLSSLSLCAPFSPSLCPEIPFVRAGWDTSVYPLHNKSSGRRKRKSKDPAYTAPPPSSAGLPGVCVCARMCVCVCVFHFSRCSLPSLYICPSPHNKRSSATSLMAFSARASLWAFVGRALFIPPRRISRREPLPETHAASSHVAGVGEFISPTSSFSLAIVSLLICREPWMWSQLMCCWCGWF